MTNSYQPEDIAAYNESSLKALVRAITLSQGQFRLILARCNYGALRDRMVQRLRELSPVEIREIVLPKSVKTLYTTIKAALGDEVPQALMVFGLELVSDIKTVLTSSNYIREEFSQHFSFPLVLWVNDEVLKKLLRIAPDLESWATSVEFKLTTGELLVFLQQKIDEIFVFNSTLHLENCFEIEAAWSDLQCCGQELEVDLEACIEFILGLDEFARTRIDEALEHYQKSLEYWQQNQHLERQGILLLDIALCYYRKAEQNRQKSRNYWEQSRDYLQQCLHVFEQAQRLDLVARHINRFAEVLQRLQAWEQLQTLTQKALVLHQEHDDSSQLAQDYGFLAEVALEQSRWGEACQLAQQALQLLSTVPNRQPQDWVLYTFLLARSQRHLGQVQEAIANLEGARKESNPQYDPQLYIDILGNLRSLYFEQGEYLKAFEIKQDQRSVEQQYGFRAFIGAGRLQPKQQVINPSLVSIKAQSTFTQEITASGRQQDVNRLVERMARNDHKLTVIQGQSGVGKSSILQAGLIPELKQKAIDTRNVLPVLQQVYSDWIMVLGQCLAETLKEMQDLPCLPVPLDSTAAILAQLRKNSENNLLTVLIFDQFEEFFFIFKEPSQRRRFYEFLHECLNISYVKVILSLREDYLYYLLECNNRLISLEVINNNILDKDILYYLGNFSVKDAKLIIQSLAERTQFFIEPSLIDALVQDLAAQSGEIRPIELQVVGAQLQTEKITKLEQYQEHGSKEKLVGRFLEEVVKDCGLENEQIAKLVLYLLTDEKNTRPLKTPADLELELDVTAEKLDLVLEILVKSGLVLRVPASPANRYQLVHDYLVAFVRQQQSAGIIAELDKEREQRKLTEAKLNQVLKRQLRTARRTGVTLAALLALIGGFAVLAAIAALNGYIAVLSYSAQEKEGIEELVTNLKAGKQLKQSVGAIADTRLLTVLRLQQAVYTVQERNRLEGHTDKVTSISFSPDGKMLASGSKDKTISLWSIDGKKIAKLRGHGASVTSVSFSRDGKMLASGSEDNTVRLWRTDGTEKEIAILRGHSASVTSISFSPDGQIIASASNDKTVKLWHLDGRGAKTLRGHSNSVVSVSFNSNGKTLCSVSNDNMFQIWTRDGTLLANTKDSELPNKCDGILNNSHSEEVVSISPDGKMAASASKDNMVRLLNYRPRSHVLKLPNGLVYGSTNLSFSPDGQTIAVVGLDKSVKLWSLNGTLLKTLPGSSQSASFSPDGQIVATTSASNILNLWSIHSRESKTLNGLSQQVTSISFSPDSQTIASSSKDGTVKLWRNDGKLLTTLKAYSERVDSANFSPDGKLLVSIGDSNIVKLWRNDGKLLTTLKAYSERVDSVNLSPDGQLIICVGTSPFDEGSIVEFRGRDGRLLKKISTLEDSYPIFSPNFKTFTVISQRKTLQLWSLDKTVPVLLKGHEDEIEDVSFSPDGKILASSSADKTIKLWGLDGALLKTLKGHSGSVNSISFSPDGKTIASVSGDGTTRLWLYDGSLSKTLDWHANGRGTVRFSSDGQLLAYVYASNSSEQNNRSNYTLKLWRRDGTLLKTLEGHSNYDGVNSMQLSPDGKAVAFFSTDNTAKLWRRDGTFLKTLEGHSDSVNRVNFSPDGEMIASASADKTVKLWQRNGTLLKTLKGHSAAVNSVSFSPKGKMIASASNETIKLWQRNGTLIKSLPSNAVDSLSFSPDGPLLASVGNGRVAFWILDGMFLKNTGLLLSSSIGQSVSFSPNGSSLAIADQRGTVVLSMSLDELLKQGCDQVRDYLKTNPNVSQSDRALCEGMRRK